MEIRLARFSEDVGAMPRSCSVSRLALPRKTIVGLLATFVSIVLLPCGVAAADTVETNFEPTPFHTGSVNGQEGWKSAAIGDIPSCFPTPTMGQYDQEVVNNGGGIPGFGVQSLRMSNACGTGEFTFQTYSKETKEPAGEEEANKEFIAQFSFFAPTTYQPGLYLSVSPVPDNTGSRMSWVGLTETPEGTEVGVADVPEITEPETVVHPVAVLARGVSHTIRSWIKLNPGGNNDMVRVSIDGKDVGQCFSSWENYYRHSKEQEGPPNFNKPPSIDRLLFRSNVQEPQLLGHGYLFDNVSITTANRAGPPGCEEPIEKQADVRTVKPGGHVGYRITVHNRGHLTARDTQVCDQIPRDMTFVSADRKLVPHGSRRCLLIPSLAPSQRVSFHLVLHVDANAPPGTQENIAEETPVPPPGVPLAPPGSPQVPPAPPAAQLGLPGSKIDPIPPAKEAKASVKVVAKRAAPRPPTPPVTG